MAAAPAAIGAEKKPANVQVANKAEGVKPDRRPVIPKPSSASKDEAEHFRRLDKAIAAVRDYQLSADDAGRIGDAFKAIGGADLDKAAELQQAISDPVGRKLVDWFRLRRGYGQAADYKAFLDANPAWPERGLLRQKLEEALFTHGGSAGEIKAAFKASGPETGVGFAALPSAYLAEGNTEEARKAAAKTWRNYNIPAELESGFLARFKDLLTAADHKWRLDRLLIDDIRWAEDKQARSALVNRLIPLLSPA